MSQYFTIGRTPDNDMAVGSNYVSSHHARLSREGGTLVIEDLGSSNGTFVDGMQITRQQITPGQQVQLSRQYTLDWNHPALAAWISGGGYQASGYGGAAAQAPTQAYQPQGGYAASAPAGKTHGLAIASMICGIAGVLIFGLILGTAGLAMGLFSLDAIKKSGGALQGKGMAIAGIVTGGVGIVGHIIWLILLDQFLMGV